MTEPSTAPSTTQQDVEQATEVVEPKVASSKPIFLWLVLVISITAAALSAWTYWQSQSALSEQQQLSVGLAALQSDLSNQQVSLTQWQNEQQALTQQLSQQQASQNGLREQLLQQQNAMQTLAQKLTEVNPNPDSAWLVAQTRGLLRLAEQQVLLANDVAGGIALLQQARQTLASNSDPRYFSVLQAIDNELLALQSLPELAIASHISQLNALINDIDQLPLTPLQAKRVQDEEAQQQWQWLTSLVAVSRFDENQARIVAPQPWLKAGLSAQLEQAKVLLMLRDEAAYQAQIEQLDEWLIEYVTPSSKRNAWSQALGGLSQVSLSLTIPESLGQSRRLLDGLEAL